MPCAQFSSDALGGKPHGGPHKSRGEFGTLAATARRYPRSGGARRREYIAARRGPARQDHVLHVRLPLRHRRSHPQRQNPLYRAATGIIRSTAASSAAKAPPASCIITPARLRKPLLRVGPRGSGEFREIEWDEAMEIAAERLKRIRATDPKKLAFFTGRDQSQSLTGWWAQQFGTPNFAAHGGFCSVNMAAGGLYTIGGSFWEFGEPDWDRTGTSCSSASPRIMIPTRSRSASASSRSAAPRSSRSIRCRTGYSPSPTNGSASAPAPTASSSGAVHELLRPGKIDLDYLVRYTNAHLAGHPGSGRGRRRAFRCATARAAAAGLGHGERTLPCRRAIRTSSRRLQARYARRRAASAVPSSSSSPSAISTHPIRRSGGGALRHVRRPHPPASPPSSPTPPSTRRLMLDRPWTDWAGRRHET